MTTVQRRLAQVLGSSKERLRISSELGEKSREAVRRSEAAVLRSQDRLLPTTEVKREDIRRSKHPVPSQNVDGNATAFLEKVEDRDFEEEVVTLNGRHFVNCRISNCILVYSGQPLLLETTHFTGCRFRFEGEAAMTMQLCEVFGVSDPSNELRAIGSLETARRSRPN